MFQVILFVTLFIFSFAVDSPAACSYNSMNRCANTFGASCDNYFGCYAPNVACVWNENSSGCPESYQRRCDGRVYTCANQCEADSVAYYRACLDSGGTWQNCACVSAPPQPDTTFHCQDAGGPVPGGFGGPQVAKLFRCVDGVCENTRDLSGSCSDWGFCSEGVSDCDIPDSLSCGRSGSRFITSSRCVYACADGSSLSCQPVSTGYVAGNIYAGECPPSPPASCRPGASSSSSGLPASSGSGLPASSAANWRDTLPSDSPSLDYTAILVAIHDTLHHSNAQRDFVLELENNMSLDLDNISNYSEYNYQQLFNINSKLSGGVPLKPSLDSAISFTPHLLDDINKYLHSDTALFNRPDTSYNPLLRDIKSGLDSVASRRDSSIFARDTVWAKWWSNYLADSASSRGLVGQALNAITHNLSVADSSKKSGCGGFYGCMRVYKNMDYCSNAWGVGFSDCVESGTPFDGIWNVEAGILETVWNGIFGDDSTTLSTLPVDTNYTPPPAADSAKRSLLGAVSALFSSDSTTAILNKVKAMKDSAEKRANDTTKIQPDSLWLDSAEAAHYVSNFLLPSGTGTDCFICSANLGTFGGLSDDDLQITIDFSNFGGFNWCALFRAVVKIVTLVVCISLTLGSWAAAFGFSPKNDA